MWVTISSFVLLLSFADLGLGNELINIVAEGVGHEDQTAIQRAVSSVFWILGAVAFLLLCADVAVYPLLHPERIEIGDDVLVGLHHHGQRFAFGVRSEKAGEYICHMV